jgi:AraC-like DNA-binding protein
MSRPLDRVTEERIADLTCEGWTAPQIASEIGVHPRTVTRVRRRTGVGGPVPVPFTADELELAEAMLADGASIAEVARTLRGTNTGALGRRFKGRGWTREQCAEYRALLRRLGTVVDA